jgi:hypothetical protein
MRCLLGSYSPAQPNSLHTVTECTSTLQLVAPTARHGTIPPPAHSDCLSLSYFQVTPSSEWVWGKRGPADHTCLACS